jgi:hypothetical protein
MLPRLIFHLATAIVVAAILGDFAFADTNKIPFKLDEPGAERLAAEGVGHGTTTEDLIYADNISDKPVPFFVYQGLSPPPAEGSFGFFAVNPWTGDVWDLWGCRRLSTPALRKSQAEIRKRFTSTELKQYSKLRRLEPQCIGFTKKELKELEQPPKPPRPDH